MIGKTLGHYRIEEKLGAGGMGEVYRAHDERLDRDVAMKVLPAKMLTDEVARKRFRKEALALSKLNHPNIATIYDFDTQDGVDFLVMEYVEGTTLSEKLSNGPLPEEKVTKLGRQVADALEEAHEHGVIHRDLKPGNVMVTPKDHAKVLDFGLAKLVRPVSETAVTESLTEGPRVAGTLPYMAPEQLQGEEVDARTDIHALGLLLYEMSTGRRAFREELATRLADAILHRAPVTPRAINARVSPDLERIILKCLEKDPENRYQAAKEVTVDLRRLQSSTPSSAVGVAAPARMTRRKAVLAAGIGLVVLAGVLIVLNKGPIGEWLGGGVSTAPIESIAVLPLDNLMRDPEQEFFVEGMTEALTSELGKIRALRVISRTSAQQIKKRMEETGQSLPEISRELNLDAVVEGSVLLAGGQVRITVQLIHAATDRHLWTESYERDLRNVLRLQSEVARAIAEEIKVAVTPEERVHLTSASPVNPEVYELYLRGRHSSRKWTPESLARGLEYFQQAIEIDPGYAPAYAGVAFCYNVTGFFGYIPAKEAYGRSMTAVTKALEIDDSLAEAHSILGASMFYYDWDWLAAEREFRNALAFNPNDQYAHSLYAWYLAAMGRKQEALAETKRSQQLDPISVPPRIAAGSVFYMVRRYDQAVDQFKQAIELDPKSVIGHTYLSWPYLEKARYEEGIAMLQKALTLASDNPYVRAELARGYAVAGKRGEAQKLLDELTLLSKQSYVSPYTIALIHTGLGQKEQAFEWLEKAHNDRASWMVWLKVDPRFDLLRSDARFQDLLRRMNFPE